MLSSLFDTHEHEEGEKKYSDFTCTGIFLFFELYILITS